jgi:hypothetical protein
VSSYNTLIRPDLNPLQLRSLPIFFGVAFFCSCYYRPDTDTHSRPEPGHHMAINYHEGDFACSLPWPAFSLLLAVCIRTSYRRTAASFIPGWALHPFFTRPSGRTPQWKLGSVGCRRVLCKICLAGHHPCYHRFANHLACVSPQL